MYQNQTEKIYTEQDFKSLLVNRKEIEKALGVVIELQKNSDEQYLEDYSLFPELRLHDVVCIFLGLHPQDWNAEQHPRYETIYNAIQQLAESGKIKATVKAEGHLRTVFLPHTTAKAIATSQGFSWTVPPYKEIIVNDTPQTGNFAQLNAIRQQLNQANAKNAELVAEIEQLRAENQNLKKTETVNYDECSIYGHSTQAIKAIFGTIQRFWINADLTQPDTVANAEDIEQWITDNYGVSKTIKEAIQKITRPEEARYLGRKS